MPSIYDGNESSTSAVSLSTITSRTINGKLLINFIYICSYIKMLNSFSFRTASNKACYVLKK